MIKTISISSFSAPDYVSQAIEGSYGLDGQKNFYLTVTHGVGEIHACGPVKVSGYRLPTPALPFFLVKCSGGNISGIPVTGSQLDFELSEGEYLHGSFRLRT